MSSRTMAARAMLAVATISLAGYAVFLLGWAAVIVFGIVGCVAFIALYAEGD